LSQKQFSFNDYFVNDNKKFTGRQGQSYIIRGMNFIEEGLITAEQYDIPVIVPFAETILPMPLEIQHVSGHVLVAAHGGAFPERLLICIPDENFDTLRNEVKSLTCCDNDDWSKPDCIFTKPVLDIPPESMNWQPQPDSIYFNYGILQDFLPRVTPDTYDSIMLFRPERLGEQFQETELGRLVFESLKPGGYFIGSGGFRNFHASFDLLKKTGFNILNITELSNSDSSGYYFAGTHMGFILQKPLA
jgi:hypothetical protein